MHIVFNDPWPSSMSSDVIVITYKWDCWNQTHSKRYLIWFFFLLLGLAFLYFSASLRTPLSWHLGLLQERLLISSPLPYHHCHHAALPLVKTSKPRNKTPKTNYGEIENTTTWCLLTFWIKKRNRNFENGLFWP